MNNNDHFIKQRAISPRFQWGRSIWGIPNRPNRPKIYSIVSLVIILCSSFVWSAEGKITVGFVEEALLLPWKIRMPARIDTGATTSSLDCRELSVKDRMVECRLPKEYGGAVLQLPLAHWKTVRSAEAKEKRPVVEIEICLGSKRVRTLVNLNDRSRVKYPLLLGRNILKDHFVVDCDKSYCTIPSCSEDGPQ